MTDTATARSAISIASLGFGAAGVLAPRLLAKSYDAPEPTPEQIYTIRIWAAATAALGVLGMHADDLDDETYLQVALGVNVIDAIAGATSSSTPRFRLMTALTSLALGGIAAAGLTSD